MTLPKWVTTEFVLIAGGFAWAVAGAFLPQIATIPVPALGIPGVIQTPEFNIGAGHMIVLGFVPVVLKTIDSGKKAFVNTTPAEKETPPDA